MPGPYAFGSLTTVPLQFGIAPGLGSSWLNSSGDASGLSPNELYQQKMLAANPNWNGQTVMPSTGATDPLTGLPASKPVAPTPATGFNPSPTPVSGTNAFGYVPGQLGLPNPAGDLQAQIPGLQGLNAQASGAISDFLGGQLSPAELRGIQDAGALFGVRSGMPGSGLQMNGVLEEARRRAHERQKEGLAAYSPFVQSVSGTQTLNPALQAQIAETNSINASAPDPTQAASYAKQLYDQYLAQLSKGAGRYPTPGRVGGSGPAGGTGIYQNNGNGGGQQFLPHVSDNQSYTPGVFDYSSQFGNSSSYTPSSTPNYVSAPGATGDYGAFNPLQFDNTFGVPQDPMAFQGPLDYPNYVQDWNNLGGNSTGGNDYLDWFGG